MSDATARNVVTGTWMALFLATLIMPVAMYATGWIGQEWFEKLLMQVNRSYAPYIGAIITFHFIARKDRDQLASLSATVIALLCAAIWNGLNLSILGLLWGAKIEADAAISVMDKCANVFAWLIAPGMGYFFGSASSRRTLRPSKKI
jgi:hypothetical protein